MASNQLNVGLIGAGRIGCLHASHLAGRIPNAELVVVADVAEEAAQRCAKLYGIPKAVRDYQTILDQSDVEAIVICAATDTHVSIIEAAAAAGKHIFCEKPLALRLEDIDRALAAVDRAHVKLQVGFNRRFDANHRRVKQAVEQGEVGKSHRIHIVSRDPAPPPLDYVKVSGGIFLDMTIHDFDLARFLIPSEVEEVYATGAVLHFPELAALGDLDTALTVLKFANGVIGTIDNSRQAVYGYDQRVEIFGSGGAIRTENSYPNTAIVSDTRSIRRDLPLNFFMERYVDSYLAEMAEFVDAVLHDQAVPVGGEDGHKATLLGLAALRSVEQNRPVRITEIGKETCPRLV